MLHEEFDPPESLRDSIKCFWYNKREFGASPTSFEVVPDGYAEIIFHFGSPCSTQHNGTIQPLPSPFLMGLLNQPIIFHTKNTLEIIAIRCYPWTVFDLLNLPSGKSGVHIFEHPIVQFQSTLQNLVQQNKIEEAISVLKHFFLDQNTQPTEHSILSKAGNALTKAKGTIPVKQVAAAAHATVRTLERKFKQSSGHTVKDVAALMRFEQVRNHLWQYPEANLAALAMDLGYSDQSHLSREFKRFSGASPAAFARNTKKRKLAVSNDFVAFVKD